MWNKCPGGRRRRAAISQSEIRKRCKLFGPLAEGYRAFNQTKDRDMVMVPYRPGSPEWKAWEQGWEMAEDKQREKRLDP